MKRATVVAEGIVAISDKETKAVIGEKSVQLTKCFNGDEPLSEVLEYLVVRGAHKCTLLFETEDLG